MAVKICFLAPSGYGKSTAIDILKENYDVFNIKIAEPLYELQTYFYKKIGMDIYKKQDGELLQFLGMKIRKENPTYLTNVFKDKVNTVEDNYRIITNDDCRPYDYQHLHDMGFIFVKILGYRRNRNDHTISNDKLPIEWQKEIPYDYILNNFEDLETYKINLLEIMEDILNDRKVLRYTNAK